MILKLEERDEELKTLIESKTEITQKCKKTAEDRLRELKQQDKGKEISKEKDLLTNNDKEEDKLINKFQIDERSGDDISSMNLL